MGFNSKGIHAITRENSLPNKWDRIGALNDENFTTLPEKRIPYTHDERAIPYLENPHVRHIGEFDNNNYFDVVDAIKDNDIDKLNTIMKKSECDKVSSIEFKDLYTSYNEYIDRVKVEIGDIDATYGLKGKVAQWKSGTKIYMNGGAEQIVTPFNRFVLKRFGILVNIK